MQEILYLLKNIANNLKAEADKVLGEYDLTLAQGRVLLYIDSQGGETEQKAIQDFLGVTHPTVIGIIARMEEKGFVDTWINIKNKKIKIVGLTAKGLFVVEDMERLLTMQEQRLCEHFSQREKDQFLKMLRSIYANLPEKDANSSKLQ